MRNKIKIRILIILTINSLFRIESQDLNGVDIFGFKMSDNIEIIKNKIKVDYRIYEYHEDFQNMIDVSFCIIEPKNQNLIEGENLDFQIYFYEDKIYRIIKYFPEQEKVNKLEQYFGNRFKINKEDSYEFKNLSTNEYFIRIKKDIKKNRVISFEIENNNLNINFHEKSFVIYYSPLNDSLRLRSSPSADGKIIRKLIKEEKLELLERGGQESISGITGNWIKVRTEKGEEGWAFDAYLEEVREN